MKSTKSEIRQFVIQTFLFGQDEGVADTDSFLEKGIVDSTGVLELVEHLQTQYGIKVEDHEMVPDNLDSIETVAAFVGKKIGDRR
jgi:acyl carrier protein